MISLYSVRNIFATMDEISHLPCYYPGAMNEISSLSCYYTDAMDEISSLSCYYPGDRYKNISSLMLLYTHQG